MKKNYIIEAVIVAVGIAIIGFCIKCSVSQYVNQNRKVSVKGLAEMEVPANKVTWPIITKEIGNDLPSLYQKINGINATIKQFLIAGGLTEEEININAPVVFDKNTDPYSTTQSKGRYNITSVITVTSSKVDIVRNIMAKQGELLKDGIAITNGDWTNPVSYEFTGLNDIKSKIIDEATKNAEATAKQFAEISKSKLGGIVEAHQGQISIENRDENTPYIKNIRVVTTVTYSLED